MKLIVWIIFCSGSSVADGSIDGLNFDGTRRGRRRKPVQLVDNAKKSKHEVN